VQKKGRKGIDSLETVSGVSCLKMGGCAWGEWGFSMSSDLGVKCTGSRVIKECGKKSNLDVQLSRRRRDFLAWMMNVTASGGKRATDVWGGAFADIGRKELGSGAYVRCGERGTAWPDKMLLWKQCRGEKPKRGAKTFAGGLPQLCRWAPSPR